MNYKLLKTMIGEYCETKRILYELPCKKAA